MEKLRELLEGIEPYSCLQAYHGIKSRLEGKYLEMPMDFFHSKVRGVDVYLTVAVRTDQPSVMLIESTKPIVDADPDEFFPLFDECRRTFPSVFQAAIWITGRAVSQNAFAAFVKTLPMEFTSRMNSVVAYYMTPKQQEKVMSLNISLPEGYRFDKANLERDAQVITDTWTHSGKNEVEQTRLKLKYCPSALVRFGDEPVGFEISSPFGTQNHQFVVEEHRQKGLGRAVEMKMCQECIHAGVIPFKFVELWNESVLKRSNNDPLWTRKNDENGEAIVTDCTTYIPK